MLSTNITKLRYFGYSVPEYEDPEFTEYRIGEQRWRTSIKGEIETIINEWSLS